MAVLYSSLRSLVQIRVLLASLVAGLASFTMPLVLSLATAVRVPPESRSKTLRPLESVGRHHKADGFLLVSTVDHTLFPCLHHYGTVITTRKSCFEIRAGL